MIETQRELAGAVRSATVAHFLPPIWRDVAARAGAEVERADRGSSCVQVLVTVPAAADAVALGIEIRALEAARGLRVLPVTAPRRAARLLREREPHVVIGPPFALGALVASSALKLGDVRAVVLAAADEYADPEDPLATLLAEVPRNATRILTAATATPAVERLLERRLHRARRVGDPASSVPVTPAGGPVIRILPVGAAAPLSALGDLLDELDPPSAAVMVGAGRRVDEVREMLSVLGYAADSALVQVTTDYVAPDTALVVLAGVPSGAVVRGALDAHPAQIVALVTTRERAALAAAAPGATLAPLQLSAAARAARTAEEALRAKLAAALADGIPAREVLALEPLLASHDALSVAAAALRLYEREREAARAAHQAGRDEALREARASAQGGPPAARREEGRGHFGARQPDPRERNAGRPGGPRRRGDGPRGGRRDR